MPHWHNLKLVPSEASQVLNLKIKYRTNRKWNLLFYLEKPIYESKATAVSISKKSDSDLLPSSGLTTDKSCCRLFAILKLFDKKFLIYWMRCEIRNKWELGAGAGPTDQGDTAQVLIGWCRQSHDYYQSQEENTWMASNSIWSIS